MYRIVESLRNTARQLIATTALAGCLTLPALAHIGAPIQISLATADEIRLGQPSVIYVLLQAAADIPQAEYQLAPPVGWQVIEGPTQWTGSLKAGEKKVFTFRAVPLSQDPGSLNALVHIPNQLDAKSTLGADRMGGRFPEITTVDGELAAPSKAKTRAIAAAEPILAQFDDGVALPQPGEATQPRLPGQDEPPPVRQFHAGSNKGTRAASVSISASGRFTYVDDNNIRRGIRNATVELYNANTFPFPDERCAAGITDANGNFTIGANCGDLFDGPDLYVRLVLNNSVVEVKPDNILAGTYAFQSGTVQNSAGGAVNFGTLNVTSNREALHLHNIIMHAQQFMATIGESMDKVTVNWPGTGTFYTPVLAQITVDSVEKNVAFEEEGDVYHEYGHHILITKAESPIPNYDNGICDNGASPSHCLFKPELGDIAWTEGWPDFFGAFMFHRFADAEGYGPTRYNFGGLGASANFPGQEDHIEGFTAAIVWDITDPAIPGGVHLSFADMWNVIKNFDPSGNLLHNHPTNVHELWSGLRQFEFGSINKVSRVYRTHGIIQPEPDLVMSSIQLAPSVLTRGATFSNIATVRNQGNESVNSNFIVRFQLQQVTTGAFTTIGTRNVPAGLTAGSSNTAPATLTVPAAQAAGTYRLRVCADSTNAVPESDGTNNCSLATGNILVQ